MRYLTIILTSLSQTAFCTFLLDDVMDREEQKKTGVSSLNETQKEELENWLNQKFTLKEAPLIEEASTDLYTSENIDGGQKLELSDGSVWIVDPRDVNAASAWIASFSVVIRPSGDPDYPCLLVNTVTQEQLRVKQETPSP